MRKMIIQMFAVFGCLAAQAQDGGEPPSPRTFFDKGTVDFWGDKKAKPAPGKEHRSEKIESLFVEPIQLPDGRTVLYTPPRPVLEFLESPTEENARKYAEWQRERMKRLREATLKLAEVSKSAEASDFKGDSANKFDLVYFKQEGCPACARQDLVLRELSNLLEVRTVTAREEIEASGVASFPTLILRDPVTKGSVRLEGATGKRELVEAMRSLRARRDAGAPASDSKEKQ